MEFSTWETSRRLNTNNGLNYLCMIRYLVVMPIESRCQINSKAKIDMGISEVIYIKRFPELECARNIT